MCAGRSNSSKRPVSTGRENPVKKKLLIGCGVFLALVALCIGVLAYLIVHRTEGSYFDSNGVRIHYTDEGSGEPVILIHGVAANADLNWRRPGVTRLLAKHFRVIAFDLRGHGLSDKPTDPAKYGVEMIEDIPRLMDHLGIQKAQVAGYSLGGFILLKLLAMHPDRLQSAAICSAGWKDPTDPSPIPNPYQPASAQPLPRFMQASIFVADNSKSLFHRVRNWVGDRILPEPVKKALKATYPALAVSQAEVEAIHVPTACFIGSQDGFRYLADDLKNHLSGLVLTEIPGANHFTTPFYGQFKQGLLDFLEAHRAGAPKEAAP